MLWLSKPVTWRRVAEKAVALAAVPMAASTAKQSRRRKLEKVKNKKRLYIE